MSSSIVTACTMHCHSVHIVDRDLNSVDSEQDLFHHLLESFACITKTEGSMLKPKTTTRRDEGSDVPRLFS